MPDFWTRSGYALVSRDGNGRHCVTDDLLRAFWMRPEVSPDDDDSCDAERALHALIMQDPRCSPSDVQIDAMADPDIRENYRVLIGFCDRLMASGTLEGCYLGLFQGDGPGPLVPALFLDQLVQIILRGLLDGDEDPYRLRAAELFFREQNATIEQGAILLGDTETVEMLATTGGMGSLGQLITEGGTPLRKIDLDVMIDENNAAYWERSDRHDMVLDVSFTRPGLDAFCRVLERWVAHMLSVRVSIQPVQKITDEKWAWHVGLDAESTMILNDLYADTEVEDDRMERLLSLFRLEITDQASVMPNLQGKPIYLALSMNEKKKVRVKPQNLLTNLPLAGGA